MKIIKNNIKTIVTGIIFTVVGVTLTTLALASTAIDLAPYENDYSEKVSNIRKIETMLETAKNELCTSERELANKKLEAYLNKDIELTKDDLVRLMNKSKWVCGEDNVTDVEKTIVKEVEEEITKDVSTQLAYDGECLYRAVANAESGFCKEGTSGERKNNCVSIMTWDRGFRELKTYDSIEENKKDFLALWDRAYGTYPNMRLAKKYTGNDNAVNWLSNVDVSYNVCINDLTK